RHLPLRRPASCRLATAPPEAVRRVAPEATQLLSPGNIPQAESPVRLKQKGLGVGRECPPGDGSEGIPPRENAKRPSSLPVAVSDTRQVEYVTQANVFPSGENAMKGMPLKCCPKGTTAQPNALPVAASRRETERKPPAASVLPSGEKVRAGAPYFS